MLLHFVCEGAHYHGSCLAASTVLTIHLNNAVLERLVVQDLLFKVVSTDCLGENDRLVALGLVAVLDGITLLVRAIKELFDLLLELAWLMVHRHEHHISRERVVHVFLHCTRAVYCLR